MTLYALYVSPTGALPQAVPERFSFLAAILPPVHALRHGLWDQLALWVAGVVVLAFAGRVIGGEAVGWLYSLLALGLGLSASGAMGRAWTRRGYRPFGYRVAADSDLARLAAMEARP